MVLCFLGIVCLLIGCGSEDKLLSELRAESGDASGGAECAGEAYKRQDGEDSAEGSPDGNAGADVTADGKAGQETDQNAGKDAGEAGGGDAPNTEKRTTIYVHVCGAVKKPGVYEMPAGSRFYEAVDAAGGFAEDACQDYLNMAAPLADGSRLEIPTLEGIQERESAGDKSGNPDERNRETKYDYYTVPEASAAATGDGRTSETGLVNINTADIAGLCALPGIGEGRAKAIIEYREKQGGFQKKEDIMQVSGIGEKMYARMEEYLTVE